MADYKKAFVYARISGGHTQTELSIKEQLHQIRRYADGHKIHIEREFTEICSAFRTGGKKQLTARKVFFDMLDQINSSIDSILIFRYDRASRTGKEFGLLEEKCAKHGVEIVSITESFGQEQGPISNFLVRNSMNLSVLYAEELSFKCKLGMRRAMKEGKLPGSVLPLGYIRLRKNVAIVDDVAKEFIQEAFHMYATGNHTYMSIAEHLGTKGFINKKGNTIGWKDIEGVIKNETYTGYKTMKWDLKKYEIQYYE